MKTNELLKRLEMVKRQADNWLARCPAHDDHNPSLSIRETIDGKTLLHCYAGCQTPDIVEAMGLQINDLFAEFGKPVKRLVEVYSYKDEDGHELYQVRRYDDKSFPIRQPDGMGGWKWTSKGIRKVPYRLPEVILAIKEGRPVVITEGEKDVHTLERLGFAATCCAGGSNGWRSEYGRYFKGADILLCGDTDEPGKQYLINVAKSCTTAKSVKKVELPPLVDDISDWVGT